MSSALSPPEGIFGPGQILGNDIANYYANNPTSQKKTGQGSRQRKNQKRTEASTNNATAPAAAAAAAAAAVAANDDDYGNDCPPTVASTTNDPVVDMDRRSRTPGISNQPWTTRGGAPASSTFNSDIPNRLARFGRSTIVTSGGESTSNDAIPIVGRELRTRPNDVEWTTHSQCLLVRTVVGGRPPCEMIAGFDLDHTLVNWTCAGWPSRPEHYELWNSTVVDECRRLHDNGYAIVIYTNQGGIKSTLKGKRAKTVCGVIDWIADILDRPVFAVVSTKKDSVYHKPSPRMWEAFETFCNGGRQARPELSFFVGDADGSGDKDDVVVGIDPRLQRHQLTGIDKSFAKNVGEMRDTEMGFFTPGEYFGPSNAERRTIPSDDDDDDGDNVRRRKAKKLKQIRRQPLGDIINFGINLENKHAGTESTPSDDIGLLSKELVKLEAIISQTLSIKNNEIFQLKAIISQIKSTMLRKDQEATALKETVAKIKEDYKALALDHASAVNDQKEEISQLKATCANVIATSKDKVSQLMATFANVITTNKKKDEEAVVLNNKISQFEVEVSTLAEERDLLAVKLDEEVQGNECVVCRESRKACLFLPCRHMCVCEGCASLIQANDRKCPLCRTVSEQVMRVFH